MTALLAVAHGSRHSAHAETIHRLTSAVRRARPATPVAAAFLELSEPSAGAALESLVRRGHRDVVVVPLLLGAAYHSSVDLPAQLAAAASRHPQLRVRQADVLGPHPLLRATLERRLRAAGALRGTADSGVVVVGAGSSRPAARRPVEELAVELTARGWGPAVAAYSSAAEPTPAVAVAALRAQGVRRVAVAPYLLAPGRFSAELAGTGADVVAAPLGDAPGVVELVLDRFDSVRTPGAEAQIRIGA